MNVQESFYVAWANLRANKMRSLFSMLGIVIGVSSVIVVVSMVNGTRKATLEEMKAGKADLLVLRPQFSEGSGRMGKLNLEDVERLKKLPTVHAVWPELELNSIVKGQIGKAPTKVYGIDVAYPTIFHLNLLSGRFFNSEEISLRPRVALITDRLARKIFGFGYPVGQRLRIEGVSLEVIGLVKEEERLKRMGQNADLFVPLHTFMKLVKEPQIYSIQIRSAPGQIDRLKKELTELIDQNPRQKGLIQLEDPREFFKETEKWAQAWMLQMALIAGVSLLVGGVGLMNVMLTTVAERTHEIGLRKAIGASSKMILRQFMVESITLSGCGGLMGVLLGILISYSLNVLSKGKVLVAVLPISVVGSFLFSLAIGLLFGLFPASKAAHLSPVEALRYE